jgi:AcrR family transcriptional regulator
MTGRPKNYNKTRILKTAHACFTRHGYAATSLSMLTESMEVSKSTFYHLYPSKEALFLACLELDAKTFIHKLSFCLSQKRKVVESLRSFFEDFANDPVHENMGLHLVLSAASELGGVHPELSEPVCHWMQVATGALQQAMELALRKGEIPAFCQAPKAALYLMNQLCGIRTLSKCGTGTSACTTLIDGIFSALLHHCQ